MAAEITTNKQRAWNQGFLGMLSSLPATGKSHIPASARQEELGWSGFMASSVSTRLRSSSLLGSRRLDDATVIQIWSRYCKLGGTDRLFQFATATLDANGHAVCRHSIKKTRTRDVPEPSHRRSIGDCSTRPAFKRLLQNNCSPGATRQVPRRPRASSL